MHGPRQNSFRPDTVDPGCDSSSSVLHRDQKKDQQGARWQVHNLQIDGSARNSASALGVGWSKITSTDTVFSSSSLK